MEYIVDFHTACETTPGFGTVEIYSCLGGFDTIQVPVAGLGTVICALVGDGIPEPVITCGGGTISGPGLECAL